MSETADAYWDVRVAVKAMRSERLWISHYDRFQSVGPPETYLKGVWDDRNWLNVPGPLYGAETDTCLAGIEQAPEHVLTDEHGQEFVWRQPRCEDELRQLLGAAYQDPFEGYGWDGDDHWTPTAVLEWWDQRERVVEWIAHELEPAPRARFETVRSPVLQAFRSYLGDELERHLESYGAWLEQRS